MAFPHPILRFISIVLLFSAVAFSQDIEVYLRVNHKANTANEQVNKPVSPETLTSSEPFYLEIWAHVGINVTDSITGGYVDITASPANSVIFQEAVQGNLFPILRNGSLSASAVTDFGGCVAPEDTASRGVNSWVRLGTITVLPQNQGQVTFSATVSTKDGFGLAGEEFPATNIAHTPTSVTIDSTINPSVAAPVFKPIDGSVITSSQTVSITCATVDASIKYKINAGAYTDYTAPFHITEDCVVTATASKAGMSTSTNSATYTVPKDTPAPVISPAEGTTFAKTLPVNITCTDINAQIKYWEGTPDDTEPPADAIIASAPVSFTFHTNTAGNHTICAQASVTGSNPSSISHATFTCIESVETPVITPAEPDFNGAVTVTLSCATDNASIFYTLNGAAPSNTETETNFKYTAPFTLTESSQVIAKAFKPDSIDSPLAVRTFTRIDPLPQPTFSVLIDGTDTDNPPSPVNFQEAATLTLLPNAPSHQLWYTTDGSTPEVGGITSHLYEQPIHTEISKNIKVIACLPDRVNSNVLTISLTRTTPLTTPAPNPASGTKFLSTSLVLQLSSNSEAKIKYTTDGTFPSSTNGEVYNGLVTLTVPQDTTDSHTFTVIAYAYADHSTDSPMMTAEYTWIEELEQPVIEPDSSPVFTPDYQPVFTISAPQDVTIPEGIILYYSIAPTGVAPTDISSFSAYTGILPFTIPESTITALASDDFSIYAAWGKDNFPYSQITAMDFTRVTKYDKPVITPPGGTFIEVSPSNITISAPASFTEDTAYTLYYSILPPDGTFDFSSATEINTELPFTLPTFTDSTKVCAAFGLGGLQLSDPVQVTFTKITNLNPVVITPASGTVFISDMDVSLYKTPEDIVPDNASIRYCLSSTFDPLNPSGTINDFTNNPYATVNITDTTEITAAWFLNDSQISDVSTAAFTKIPKIDPPVITPADGTSFHINTTLPVSVNKLPSQVLPPGTELLYLVTSFNRNITDSEFLTEATSSANTLPLSLPDLTESTSIFAAWAMNGKLLSDISKATFMVKMPVPTITSDGYENYFIAFPHQIPDNYSVTWTAKTKDSTPVQLAAGTVAALNFTVPMANILSAADNIPNTYNKIYSNGITMTLDLTAEYTGCAPTNVTEDFTVFPTLTPPAFNKETPFNFTSSNGNITVSNSMTANILLNARVFTYITYDGTEPSAANHNNQLLSGINTSTAINVNALDEAYKTKGELRAVNFLYPATVTEPQTTDTPIMRSKTAILKFYPAGAPKPPAISPQSCFFANSKLVSISGDGTNPVLYTIDGSDPKTSSTASTYTQPFTVTQTTTVRAVAINEGTSVFSPEATSATFTGYEDWTTPTLTNNMYMFAEIFLDGDLVTTENSSVVLVNEFNEVRGSGTIVKQDGLNVFMIILSSPCTYESSLTMLIHIPGIDSSISVPRKFNFTANESIGSIDQPFIINANSVVSLPLTLKGNGWTWFSINCDMTDTAVGAVLGTDPALYTLGDKVNNSSSFTSWDPAYTTWFPDTFQITSGKTYTIYRGTSGNITLELTGSAIPANTQVPLQPGWNWPGYTGRTTATAASMAHSGGFTNGDMISNGQAFATYYNNTWIPSTFQLIPGHGYKMKCANGGALTFNNQATRSDTLPNADEIAQLTRSNAPDWISITGNDIMISYFKATVNGNLVTNSQSMLAAFIDGEQVNFINLVTQNDRNIFPLQFSPTDRSTNKIVTFKLYDADTDQVYDIDASYEFVKDAAIGDINTPVILAASLPGQLSAAPTQTDFPPSASLAALNISTDQIWTAQTDRTWITLSQTTGTGNAHVNFTITANTGAATRSGSITISANNMEDVVINITQAASGIVATPAFSQVSGYVFPGTLQLTLTCATDDATIRYTTDGSEPTEDHDTFLTPITLSATTTVKAKAFKADMTPSATASATFFWKPENAPDWNAPGGMAFTQNLDIKILLGENPVSTEGSMLAVFDSSGACRGATHICLDAGIPSPYFPLTINAHEPATMYAKVFNAATGQIHDIFEPVSFTPNTPVGTPENPAAMHAIQNAIINIANLSQVYDGIAKTVTPATTPAGLDVSILYDGQAAPPVNAGSYAVTASVTSDYYSGTATGTLTVAKATQTISFNAPDSKRYGDSPFTLSAASTSGLPVSFSSSAAQIVAISNNEATIAGVGTALITAAQAGNDNYLPADPVIRPLTIAKGLATVTISNLSQVHDGTPKTVTVSTAPENLTTAITYPNGTAPVNAGSHEVTATVVSPLWEGTAMETMTITKGTAILTLTNLEQTYTGSAIEAAVTTAPANLAAAFTYNGASVKPVNAGTYAVTATVIDNNWQGTVQGQLVISKAPQTIAFSEIAPKHLGEDDFTLTATATSGLPVTYTSHNESVVRITNSVASITACGMATITAAQSGNDNYLAAEDVSIALTVLPANWNAPEETKPDNAMTIYATVNLYGEKHNTPGSRLGAFVNGICQGYSQPLDELSNGCFILPVNSTVPADSQITFILFNSSNGNSIHIATSLIFTPGAALGSQQAPIPLMGAETAIDIPVIQGYNWVSFNCLPEDSHPANVLNNIGLRAGDQVNSQTSHATLLNDGVTWSPANFVLQTGVMYQINRQAETPATLSIQGLAMNPASSISVTAGCNWIGFPGDSYFTIDKLVHSAGFTDGDFITDGQNSAEFTDCGDGLAPVWIAPDGFLLKQGAGYKLTCANAGEISVNFTGQTRAEAQLNPIRSTYFRTPKAWKQPQGRKNAMTRWISIPHIAPDVLASSKIAAFDADGNIMGTGTFIDRNGTQCFPLTLSSNKSSDSHISILWFNPVDGWAYPLGTATRGTLAFEADLSPESPASPLVLTCSDIASDAPLGAVSSPDITVERGWNLLSTPFSNPHTDSRLFRNVYQLTNGVYVRTQFSSLKAGESFWLFNPGPQFTVTFTGERTRSQPPTTATGWQFRGTVEIEEQIKGMLFKNGKYIPATKISIGQGSWNYTP